MVAAFFLPLADTTVTSHIWYFLLIPSEKFGSSQLFSNPDQRGLFFLIFWIPELSSSSFSAQSSSCPGFPIADSINPGGTFPIPLPPRPHCTAHASNKRLFIWMRHDPPNVPAHHHLESSGGTSSLVTFKTLLQKTQCLILDFPLLMSPEQEI